jgi:hypothetical protein
MAVTARKPNHNAIAVKMRYWPRQQLDPFYAGWLDRGLDLPFAPEYESGGEVYQYMYEQGRLYRAALDAIGCAIGWDGKTATVERVDRAISLHAADAVPAAFCKG